MEHFHEQVIAKKKIGGKARAMVVTASIPRCIEYYYAINKCLSDRHSPYKTIVAFSGEHKYNGQEPALTSAAMNGFPDAKIPKEFKNCLLYTSSRMDRQEKYACLQSRQAMEI